jgi:predicted nucleic acid-binding protein
MIVVDASALLEVLLGTSAAGAVGRRLFDPRQTLHAPHLLDLEVTQAIRRFAAISAIDGQRARAALDDLADFPCSVIRMTVVAASVGASSQFNG